MTTYHYSQTFGDTVVSGNTPYGIFDSDTIFTTDCLKTSKWNVKKLGYPFIKVELNDEDLYGAYEESALVYNRLVTSHQATNWFLDYFGQVADTGSNYTPLIPRSDINFIKTLTEPVVQEAGGNSRNVLYTGSFVIPAGTQTADLKEWANASASGYEIQIKEVWHTPTPAMLRYFYPYEYGANEWGGQLGLSYAQPLLDQGMMIYPAFTNVLRANAIEMNQMVRRGAFSYILNNNVVKITPTPTDNLKIWFSYYKLNPNKEFGMNWEQSNVSASTSEEHLVTNIANIPFDQIVYKTLNISALDWIRRYSFAVTEEILGNIRGKLQSIPAPAGDITLDFDYLRSDATEKKNLLLEELKEKLGELSYDILMEKKANIQEQINRSYKFQPYPCPISVG